MIMIICRILKILINTYLRSQKVRNKHKTLTIKNMYQWAGEMAQQ